MNIERAAIEALSPDPANVRRHGDRNIEAIKASLRRFGQQKPIVVDGDGVVRAGNCTLAAAKSLGWTEIAVVRTELTGADAAAFAIADNRTAELAEWEDAQLVRLLEQVGLEGTGFTDDDLAELLDATREPAPLQGDPDEIPDEPNDSSIYVELGDLWQLGDHRLLAGDSTRPEDVARVMTGDKAACLYSDPPYGVNYQGGTEDKLTIQNDGAEGLPALLEAAFRCANDVLAEGAAIYIFHPAGANSVVFANAFVGAGWRLHQGLVWRKDAFVLGHSDHHYAHEPVLFGYAPGGGRRGRGGEGWYGPNNVSSVFDVPRPKRNDDHPTSKPVALITQMLANSTAGRDIVYEPFGGSGSTLIACEQLGRRCRALEIDRRYAQVIIDRWERITGRKAEKIGGAE
ncbi:MAG: DNA modification methylase [Deltaproteobacteria bacterium]|nr:DNA modification methylase [Deltaproteobacteria bacterium]